ncbi:MAG: PAS domain S-box protein [Hyphomicrobiaceae bacterium]|nr:PAS domain S-box protein [Hyphomicrobiaceae bacterium]
MGSRWQQSRPDARAISLMAEAAPVMIWASDHSGACIWFNQSWLAFVGRHLEEEVGDGWAENVHPDDLNRCLAEYRAAVATRRPFSSEYRLRRYDGVYRWLLDNGTPHFDAVGRFAGFVGSCTDVTALKDTEAALRISEARFRLLADSAPVMLWLSDPDGRCLLLNQRLRDFWRITNDQLATFDWAQTLHPHDLERVGALVGSAVARKQPFIVEARYRDHTGAYRTLRTEAVPTVDAWGTCLGFIGVNVDITDALAADAELRRSQERFARFMTHLPGLAWIKDEAGRYVFANDAAAAAFAMPVERIIGRTDAELFPVDIAAEFRRNDIAARASTAGVRVIEQLRHSDGIIHHSIVSKFAIPGDDQRPTMTGGVAIDVTDHKAAEDRIKRLNEDLRLQLEEREALLAALPVGVAIASDPACRDITMNPAGAAMLRRPLASNGSDQGSVAATPTFRVLRHGTEVPTDELPLQRAARLGQPVIGDEFDIAFADGTVVSVSKSATPLFDSHGQVRGCVGVFVDISGHKHAERRQNLLIDELNHRAKNMLAIVQSISAQTLRRSSTPKEFAADFSARIEALARTHALLTGTTWEGAPLDQLVAAALAPFVGRGCRVTTEGPSVSIKPALAVTVSLLLHELVTNAVKHGALRSADGRLSIRWVSDTQGVVISWQELCPFAVTPPTRRGFGSRLIEASGIQFGAPVDVNYGPEGLCVRISLPTDIIARS